MKRNIFRYSGLKAGCVLVAASGTLPVAVSADNLEKEITVEREIVPEVRAASRLNIYPRPLAFKSETPQLSFSRLTDAAAVPAMVSTLEPASTEPAAAPTPWRGYVDLGYFPVANAALSAGYSLVQANGMRLNVWGQFDNSNYKMRPVVTGAGRPKLNRFDGALGLDFSYKVGESGTLTASTSFDYGNFTRSDAAIASSLDPQTDMSKNQNVVGWDISAMWNGHAVARIDYRIGAGFSLFDFGKGNYISGGNSMEIKPVGERVFNVDLGVTNRFLEYSTVGADLSASLSAYPRFRNYGFESLLVSSVDPSAMQEALNPDGKTVGIVSLSPYYRYARGKVALKVGLRLDFAVNSGSVVHVAPDVLFAVTPTGGFGAWLRVEGGEQLNSLRQLYGITPYVSPLLTYRTSGVPVKGDFGLRFGPVKGASLTLKLSYGMANRWLMPTFAKDNVVFFATDLRSWKAAVDFNWSYRSLLSLRAGYAAALGSGDRHAWLEWHDRARHVVSAAVTVNPWSALGIDLSYELRMNRRMPVADGFYAGCLNLSDESMLNVGASYRVSDSFSVFARCENLLNKRSMLVPFISRQGITGLVGIGVKF